MPTRSYTLQMGRRIPLPTEGAGSAIPAVNGNGIQLLVDYTGAMRLHNILQMLDDLKAHLIDERWPPA